MRSRCSIDNGAPGLAADRDVAWGQTPSAKVAVVPFLCASAPPTPGKACAITSHRVNHQLLGVRLTVIGEWLAHTPLTAEIPSASASPWTWAPVAEGAAPGLE